MAAAAAAAAVAHPPPLAVLDPFFLTKQNNPNTCPPCPHTPQTSFNRSSTQPNPTQNHFRSAVTDEHLRVRGSNGSIFALGDAATIEQAKAVEKATQLFDKHAQTHPDGRLTLPELQQASWGLGIQG